MYNEEVGVQELVGSNPASSPQRRTHTHMWNTLPDSLPGL